MSDAAETAQRIAELHPPVDGRWNADACPAWIAEIRHLISVHTEAALLADRLARHDETVAAIEAAVLKEREDWRLEVEDLTVRLAAK